MTSSIFSLQSASSETSRVLRSRIQSRNCLSQNHGCDQSSSTTIKVFGIVSGVRSGCSRGVNDGEGSERRYIERRARMSVRREQYPYDRMSHAHLRGLRPEHHDMCNPTQSCLQRVAVCYSVGLLPFLTRPRRGSRGILFAIRGFLLKEISYARLHAIKFILPRTRIFFSGRCFPVATLSSMEDHMSFLASALFGLS